MTFVQYYYRITISAEIAQLVEHFTRNEGVVGSSPIFSLTERVPDCRSERNLALFYCIGNCSKCSGTPTKLVRFFDVREKMQ